MPVSIEKASADDLAWVNEQYAEVDFEQSHPHGETIVIASVDDKRAGVGRLVHLDDGSAELGGIVVRREFRGRSLSRLIVGDLIQRSNGAILYCLPFAKLENLYASFGFERSPNDESVPQRLRQKLDYCSTHYDDDVILMKRGKRVAGL